MIATSSKPRVLALLGALAVLAGAGGPPPAPVTVDGAGLLRAARAPGASCTVINVWATWCEPCREEFPDLLKLRTAFAGRGLRLVLVSADFPEERAAVQAFLRAQGVDFATWLKDAPDEAFIDALDRRWSGALPATFVLGPDGRVVEWWEGKRTYTDFARSVTAVLGRAAPGRTR
jgi:thiol-disulfide isomerase/thioredoxin